MDTARNLSTAMRRRVGGRVLRRRQRSFYRAFIDRRSLVFDVGANVGQRTDLFLSMGAKVVAYEPMPSLAAELKTKFAAADIRAVGLGARPGIETLHVADVSTISSMSGEWRDAVQRSGRFRENKWEKTVDVPVSTLDAEIDTFGLPDFCKIDVEGFELEVLRGLSVPIPAVSVEYTAEHREVGFGCLERLADLGNYEFSFSAGESMRLWQHGWVHLDAAVGLLDSLPGVLAWGDAYARVIVPDGPRGH